MPTAGLDLVHYLAELVAFRCLQRRELLERLEPLESEFWPIGSMFQSYMNAVDGESSAPPILMAVFWSIPTVCSNGSRLMSSTSMK